MSQQSHTWHMPWGNRNFKTHLYSKVRCSTLYNSQDIEATKAYIWFLTGSTISQCADHAPQTRAERSEGLASPLGCSGNRHVFLRSQRDDDREDVVWMMWCGTSPQSSRFSPSHQGTRNSPLPTWRSPLWPGLSFPDMIWEVSCQNARLQLRFLWEGPPSSLSVTTVNRVGD